MGFIDHNVSMFVRENLKCIRPPLLYFPEVYMAEKIAVIGGTGDLGFGLALRWAKAGNISLLVVEKRRKLRKLLKKCGQY